ncbi:hypothetical protein PDESU_02405 [Pontiella desulfatans]|uniref:Glycosyl hydrolase family 95 N-terminal domain-containing protein n=1 Tax=Pontiella desulfatans TaxID=2750659 RepID=A0A6C2U1K2_PONDE|nr:Tat pathway signal sequence domain protein [Pontiella desulfatans]VGO13848.1 hypothetical protein PDESU_02405 [Pontiella desulfatans]
MNGVGKIKIAVAAIWLGAASAAVAAVDWATFLARHDLVWTEAPQAWHDGPFLGNGMLGSMLHQVDDHTLRISLGRADMEDHQPEGTSFIKQSRLPNGYFTLKTVGKITGFDGRLDLYNAETRVTLTTERGTVDILGLVHSQDMAIFYELKPSAGEQGLKLDFVPLHAISPARLQAELAVEKEGEKAPKSRQGWAKSAYTYNPDPELATVDGYSVSRQPLTCGGENGTAWFVKDGGKGAMRLYVSIEHSYPEATATADAVAHLKKIEAEPFEKFISRHRNWWHDYYPQSFISLDDTRMESFYWIQVYKFGSGARKGRAFMDTMGPWMVENTAWANGWFNLNTQLSYWFLSTANRLEVAESLFARLDEKLPQLIANMPDACGGECAGMGSIVPQTFISPVGRVGNGFMGELLWTCHDYWLMLERTMDAERTTGKFFPLLKKSVNTYLGYMVEGDDGKLHLPPTRSPEYGGGEDCNFNLALFRWGLSTLIQLDRRYGIGDPLLPKWKDVHARLVDYPTNENGYMVAKDFPFAQSHRHYSHLMMIYPLIEVNWDQPENRGLIEKSVDHWINYPGTGNAGYSFSGAAAMYALMENGEEAARYLDVFMRMQELFPKSPGKIWCTTMYTETSRIQPVTETPLSLCDSMQLMLLQSWGDKIRVFPATPDHWKNIAFDGLLAKGGFEVSAKRAGGITQFIRIKSNAGEPCLLKTDIKLGRIEGIPKEAVKRGADGTLNIDLKKGQTVTLFADGVESLVIEPVETDSSTWNSFGLNERYKRNG